MWHYKYSIATHSIYSNQLGDSNDDVPDGKQIKVTDKGKNPVAAKCAKVSEENYVPKYSENIGIVQNPDRHPITNELYKPLTDDPFFSGQYDIILQRDFHKV